MVRDKAETVQTISATTRVMREAKAKDLVAAIDGMCETLGPGGKVPTHRELMRRFGASERMVLAALDEMQRRKRIERRYGSGTYVANSQSSKHGKDAEPVRMNASRTILTIAQPDPTYLDRCVEMLHGLAHAASLDLLLLPMLIERQHDISIESVPDAMGYVVFGRRLLPIAARIQENGHRVVCVGTLEIDEHPLLPVVSGDQQRGGSLAVEHLLALGHTRIAFVGDEGVRRSPRWRGNLRTVVEAQRRGIDAQLSVLDADEIFDLLRSSSSKAREYFKRSDTPSALMFWNDTEAAEFITAAMDAGIDVPGDVSVVGYDASPRFSHLRPSLSSVEPFLGDMLRAALDLVLQPNPATADTSVLVIPRLVAGASSGTVRS